jgi:hypothetical protein
MNIIEQQQNTIVLFPGGFKPITGAHLTLANRYAENPTVRQVIMLIGPKERDGITRQQTIDSFNLLNSNPKIVIRPTEFNSPITAAYEYLFALPKDTVGQYAMAASTKGDDYVRAKTFVPTVDKYKITGDKSGRKIPQGVDAVELTANTDPIQYSTGEPVSATSTRAAIADGDYRRFKESYPGITDEILKNVWEIFTNKIIENAFSLKWWSSQLAEDVESVFEGYQDSKTAEKHKKKIGKLRKFLDKNTGKEFVYDFDTYDKTVLGVPLTEGVFLIEGGAGGHMAHPYEDHGLTFNDMKELISRALEGHLDIEDAVTEKTDGQNIQVTWKNGQVGFARNKGTIKNPLSADELTMKFADYKGPIADAFKEAAQDITAAFSKIDQEKLNQIFKNGMVFANMEIIYPATKNVINYDKAHLQFHNLVEYDLNQNKVQTDLPGGALVQKIIQDANMHMQNTFSFIAPQKIKLGRIADFEDQQAALFSEVDQLKNQFNLKETDLLSDYHRAWWRDVIETESKNLNYPISDEILELLVDRWAFGDKSTAKPALLKMIDNEQFKNFVSTIDGSINLKKYQKQNMEPFESIFLRLGALVLSNVSEVLAADPTRATRRIKQDIANVIKQVKQTNDIEILKKVEYQLKRLERLGGLDRIVPIEGIVFTFKGNTYKLTGAFAPVNQLIGILKYGR